MTDTTAHDGDRRRGGGKAPGAYRTISEVAEEIDVPAHVLRFWEGKFPQVKPLKRAGGRRYYRPDDVVLLRRIRDLLYAEGYTIKGVQKLLREGGAKAVAERVEAGAAGAAAQDPDLLDALARQSEDEVFDEDQDADDIVVEDDETDIEGGDEDDPTDEIVTSSMTAEAVAAAERAESRVRDLLAADERRRLVLREAFDLLNQARAILDGTDEDAGADDTAGGGELTPDESFAQDVFVVELADGETGADQPAADGDATDEVEAAGEERAETAEIEEISADEVEKVRQQGQG
ncbi:MerR family transcriptional regulator [Tistrella mobilis]|uniref:MerR family transcriptional regulator n=1 Tax=Tistrella mobilis TaxID=171437 RepID=UPI003202CAA3